MERTVWPSNALATGMRCDLYAKILYKQKLTGLFLAGVFVRLWVGINDLFTRSRDNAMQSWERCSPPISVKI